MPEPTTSYLTPEIRALIGTRGLRLTAAAPLGADELRRFVHAVMDPDPVHWDADAARREGYPAVVAPPLYVLHAFRRADGTPDPFERLGSEPDWDGTEQGGLFGLPLPDVGLKRVVNGGTEAEFFQMPVVGTVISAQAAYADITERHGKSGPMVIVSIQTEFTDESDALLARVRQTMIVR